MSEKVFFAASLIILVSMPSTGMCKGGFSGFKKSSRKAGSLPIYDHLESTLLTSDEYILDPEASTEKEMKYFSDRVLSFKVPDFKVFLKDVVMYRIEKSSSPHLQRKFLRCLPGKPDCHEIPVESHKTGILDSEYLSYFPTVSKRFTRDGVSCEMMSEHDSNNNRDHVYFMCQSLEESSHVFVAHRYWEFGKF